MLAETRFHRLRWVAETGSTNSDAMASARDGAPEGVVVVADHQGAGRGRLGRTWTAPPGASLLVSVLLRPPAGVVGAVGMAVGLAMAEAVSSLTVVVPGLKWPNDLVVADRGVDRKLGGILAEADWPAGSTASSGWRAPRDDERMVVVVGVGVNVNWPASLPDDLAATATALNHLVGHDVDRVELLVAFLRRLDGHYGGLVAAGSASGAGLLDAWRARSATLGRRVRVDLGSSDVEGTAVDVTPEGHLVVATDEGDRRTFAAGDVVHLRPT
ncbi:MAG TPA: biotin--[acetyl-CoA-carboxylase] ligase [Acidimicrobiales bacterium]|nr:biotin--[acetyl-CoA-carboxylase] ligase [Acidimicrobiales bacterium]